MGAKDAVLGFSKALAREVGRYTVNVNCVAIGATAHEGLNAPLNLDVTPETDPILENRLGRASAEGSNKCSLSGGR